MNKITKGFTLIEIAVSLVIMGLLLGGIVIPVSDSFKNAISKGNAERISTAKEALIGYAIRNQKLPCPATNLKDGIAATSCYSGKDAVNGFLPWKELNLQQNDAWGNAFFYSVDEQLTNKASFLAVVRGNNSENSVDAIKIKGRDDSYAEVELSSSVSFVIGTFGKQGIIFDSSSGKLFGKSTGSLSLTGASRPADNTDERLNLKACCESLPSSKATTSTYYSRTQMDTPVPTLASSIGPFDDQLYWMPFYQLVGIMTQSGRLQ